MMPGPPATILWYQNRQIRSVEVQEGEPILTVEQDARPLCVDRITVSWEQLKKTLYAPINGDRGPLVYQLVEGEARTTGRVVFLAGSTRRAVHRRDSAGPRGNLIKPPGVRVRSVLNWIYSPTVCARVFDVELAEMQKQWYDATVAGKKWKARWVRLRGYWAIANSVGLQTVVSFALKAWKIFRGAMK